MSDPEPGERVLVCDLDQSLVRVNTFPSFAPFALRQLLLRFRWIRAVVLASAAVGRRLGVVSHTAFKAEVSHAAEALPEATIRAWAVDIVRDHLNPDVAEVVGSWDGFRLLSTAAPEIYARHIGLLLGFDQVHGSLQTWDGFHDNAGQGKVTRLMGTTALPVDLVITDDEAGDAPLIAAARSHQIVVPGSSDGVNDATPRPASTHAQRRNGRRPPTVYIAASLGGHLELLEALVPATEGFAKVWITSEGVRAKGLRESGESVVTLPRLDRSALSAHAVTQSVRLALRERPKLVLTSGAGLVVPFCAVSRSLGASIVFVETMARVQRPSMSGWVVSRLGARVFVQWNELASAYREATICRPVLLAGIGETEAGPGSGTFVTVGSHDQPFARLMGLVQDAAQAGNLPRPIIVQGGTDAHMPTWADEHHPFVSPDTFRSLMASAAVVITHGGAGAMATALHLGRKPIVVPRRKRWSEHVDDHQLDLADKLESLRLVVRGDEGISAQVTGAASTPVEPAPGLSEGLPLEEAVRDALVAASHRRGR